MLILLKVLKILISLLFLFLVSVLLIVYYVLPKKWNLQSWVLLVGSLIFYISFDLRHVFFLLFVLALFVWFYSNTPSPRLRGLWAESLCDFVSERCLRANVVVRFKLGKIARMN